MSENSAKSSSHLVVLVTSICKIHSSPRDCWGEGDGECDQDHNQHDIYIMEANIHRSILETLAKQSLSASHIITRP